MKNIFKTSSAMFFTFILVGILASCDKGFKDINTSIDFVSEPNLDYQLPFIQLTMEDKNYYTISRVGVFVSQLYITSAFSKMIVPSESTMGEHFKWMYQNPLKNVADFIEYAQTDPDKINYLSIGRILRVQCFNLVTDSYGDIPYFEASKGYIDQVMRPNYDPQQKIYEDMFKELSEAIAAFNISKPTPPSSSDIVYKGDISKWKKFANSLMLRLALRIYNVDQTNGKKYIEQAIAGGLLESNDDNYIVYTQPNTNNTTTANGIMKIFISTSYIQNYRLSAPFVDSLKNRNDPRLTAYSMLPTEPYSAYQDGDHTYAMQEGAQQFSGHTKAVKYYSTPNINTFARYDAPMIWLSYAQVQFNLAECVVRGIISGDAKTYYENGVRAAMAELSAFGPQGVINSEQTEEYLLANPYDPDNALVMINTQYWIETFSNWYECWANVRRTGIPDTYSHLDKSKTANIGAELPRKLILPSSEITANPNAQKAITKIGFDVTTRMWWDIK